MSRKKYYKKGSTGQAFLRQRLTFLHTTPIFGNLNKSDTEKTWKDTKSNLARKIMSAIPEFEENAVYCNIEKVYRKHRSKRSKSKYQPLVIVAEFGTERQGWN